MKQPERGELWIVDLGIAAKIRPAVVISVVATDDDRSVITIVPHTTSLRGTRFEVAVSSRFLKAGAFDCQNLLTIPRAKFVRSFGKLSPTDMTKIEAGVRAWLGFAS